MITLQSMPQQEMTSVSSQSGGNDSDSASEGAAADADGACPTRSEQDDQSEHVEGHGLSNAQAATQQNLRAEYAALRQRTIALVGLMGAGKTTVGRRLAQKLRLPFFDTDDAIEQAAGESVADIFAHRGEVEFRRGERRVIARLLEGQPHVLATGGGAFIEPSTRALLQERAITVWLRAPLDLTWRRVSRRSTRPLLKTPNPQQTLHDLWQARAPIYAEAELVVDSLDGPHDATVEQVLTALKRRLNA